MTPSAMLWVGFAVLVCTVMVIDLGILQKKAHAVSLREASLWCLLWFSLSMGFCLAIHFVKGPSKAMEFLAGYLLELSLSVDNMFVFVMIFQYFAVSRVHQPRILHWGILGAVVMRFGFIFIGVELINTFKWMIYVFGGLLVWTGARMAVQKEEDRVDPRHSLVFKLFRKVVPMTEQPHGQDFLVRQDGRWFATPLMATLVMVEFSDVIFAIDSIPAIIAITPDPFIVYTSNVFAIMGLRSLYFLLSGLAERFRYLKWGISIVLVFVGFKMLGTYYFHIPIALSLGVIISVIGGSMAASWFIPPAPEQDRAG